MNDERPYWLDSVTEEELREFAKKIGVDLDEIREKKAETTDER